MERICCICHVVAGAFLQLPCCRKKVLWRGEVTCFDGSKMDAWAYTLVPGLSLGARPCNV